MKNNSWEVNESGRRKCSQTKQLGPLQGLNPQLNLFVFLVRVDIYVIDISVDIFLSWRRKVTPRFFKKNLVWPNLVKSGQKIRVFRLGIDYFMMGKCKFLWSSILLLFLKKMVKRAKVVGAFCRIRFKMNNL